MYTNAHLDFMCRVNRYIMKLLKTQCFREMSNLFCTCSSVDRAMVSGTMWQGFESLQVRFAFTKVRDNERMCALYAVKI